MVTVTNETELAKAMANNEPTIEIIGDLANKTIKIKASGSIAWAIAFAALGTAILSSLRDDYKIVEENSNRVVLKRR